MKWKKEKTKVILYNSDNLDSNSDINQKLDFGSPPY